jgi:hypothetical protein
MDTLSDAEDLARTFHAELCAQSDSPTWTWDELSPKHQQWKTNAAQAVIDAGWVKVVTPQARAVAVRLLAAADLAESQEHHG